jgi:hypothetical protein
MTIQLIHPTDGGVMEVETPAPSEIAAVGEDELHALAYSLAYEMAESIIRSESLTFYDENDEKWFEVEPEAEVELVDAMRYLELRGLLERRPENPNHLQVRDESEATA